MRDVRRTGGGRGLRRGKGKEWMGSSPFEIRLDNSLRVVSVS